MAKLWLQLGKVVIDAFNRLIDCAACPCDTGTGTGTGVEVGCCPGVTIPGTLYAHVTGVGDCDCVNVVIPINRIEEPVDAESAWFGTGTVTDTSCLEPPDNDTISVLIECRLNDLVEPPEYQWDFSIEGGAFSSTTPDFTPTSCDPFLVTLTAVGNNCAGTGTIVISEVP